MVNQLLQQLLSLHLFLAWEKMSAGLYPSETENLCDAVSAFQLLSAVWGETLHRFCSVAAATSN